MRNISASLYSIYNICKRQLWLFSHELNPYQDDEFLVLGRMIHENSYKRVKKEIVIDGCKFDLVQKKGENYIIGEVKKSSKSLSTGINQMKYYLYRLKQKGIITHGEVLIPKEKKRVPVSLTEEDEQHIENTLKAVEELICEGKPPPAKRIPFCKNCAYNDFCWS